MAEKDKTKSGGKGSKGSKATKAKDKKQDKVKPAQETKPVEPVKTLEEIKKTFTVADLKDKDYKIREYNLHYSFTEPELKDKASELADENISKLRLEEQKKDIVADFKAKIEKKTANINLLAQQLSSGREMRNIKCRVFLNQPIEGQKTIVRTDIEEIVKIEEMEQHEFQEELNLLSPEAEAGGKAAESKDNSTDKKPEEQENNSNMEIVNPQDQEDANQLDNIGPDPDEEIEP